MLTNHPRLNGVLTGLAVTAVCTVYFFGINPEHKLELLTFDYRVRGSNNLEATPPIVHVDIDDNALERVGRWPWHRDEIADFIRILDELGAEVIAIDLLLSEPEAPRVDDPRYSRDADVEPDVRTVGTLRRGISRCSVAW